GYAPIDLKGDIVNLTKHDANFSTAVGFYALEHNISHNNTAIGHTSARNLKKAANTVAIGRGALEYLEKDKTTDGKNLYEWSKTGTYEWSGTEIVVNMPNHGLLPNYVVSLGLTSGTSNNEENHYEVISATKDTFTIE